MNIEVVDLKQKKVPDSKSREYVMNKKRKN
jgi:hypothetical protein